MVLVLLTVLAVAGCALAPTTRDPRSSGAAGWRTRRSDDVRRAVAVVSVCGLLFGEEGAQCSVTLRLKNGTLASPAPRRVCRGMSLMLAAAAIAPTPSRVRAGVERRHLPSASCPFSCLAIVTVIFVIVAG